MAVGGPRMEQLFSLFILPVLAGMIQGGPSCEPTGINGVKAGSKVHRMIQEALGTREIQDAFDKYGQMDATVPDGEVIVDQMAEDVSKNLQKLNGYVEKLRLAIESDLAARSSKPAILSDCCTLQSSELGYLSSFKDFVDLQRVCYMKQTDEQLPPNSVSNTLDAMRKNHVEGTSMLKWQYYGTTEGLFINYPTQRYCDVYDPRNRPWYVESATPVPKILVIVVDVTGGEEELTRKAVSQILDVVNPKDKVGLVLFGAGLYSVTGRNVPPCFDGDLASATPHNIQILKHFIGNYSMRREQIVAYDHALTEAFRMIEKKIESTEEVQSRVVVFLTHSDLPEIDNLPAHIGSLQAEISNSMYILTYSLGSGVSAETFPILDTISTINRTLRVDKVERLPQTVGVFYQHLLKLEDLGKPIIAAPYLDAGGLGMVLSFCLPVYRGTEELYGVTCVDGQLLEILFNVTMLYQTNIYAFIIDHQGNTFIHPSLPPPEDINDRPKLVDITTLEQDPRVREVIEKMKNGTAGKASLESMMYYSGRPKQTTLHYNFRNVPGTSFSICLVTTQDYLSVTLGAVTGVKSHYLHPRLLVEETDGLCLLHQNLTNLRHSSVILGDQAFTERYVPSKEDHEAYRFRNYFGTDDEPLGLNIKAETKDWVILTGLVDDIWPQTPASTYNGHVLWRHLATESGIYRTYPATSVGVDEASQAWYLQYTSQWYKDTLSNGDIVSLSTSIHPFSRVQSVRVSSPLYISRNNRNTQPIDEIQVGAVAAEFDAGFFYYNLINSFANCLSEDYRCLLVDNAGFILAPKSEPDPDEKGSDFWSQHLTQKEAIVAEMLIDDRHLLRRKCINHSALRIEYLWILQVPEGLFSHCDGSVRFEIHVIYRTNAFLLIISSTPPSILDKCNCKEGDLKECSSDSQCNCPCFEGIDFDNCMNRFKDSYKEILQDCPRVERVLPPQISFSDDKPSITAAFPPCDTTMLCRNGEYYDVDLKSCGKDVPQQETKLSLLVLLLIIPLTVIIVACICCLFKDKDIIRNARIWCTDLKGQLLDRNTPNDSETNNAITQTGQPDEGRDIAASTGIIANTYIEGNTNIGFDEFTPTQTEDPFSDYAHAYQAHAHIMRNLHREPDLVGDVNEDRNELELSPCVTPRPTRTTSQCQPNVHPAEPKQLNYAQLVHQPSDEDLPYMVNSPGDNDLQQTTRSPDDQDLESEQRSTVTPSQQSPISLRVFPDGERKQDSEQLPHYSTPYSIVGLGVGHLNSSAHGSVSDHIPTIESIIGDEVYTPCSIHEGYSDYEDTGTGQDYFFPEGYAQNMVSPYKTVPFDFDNSANQIPHYVYGTPGNSEDNAFKFGDRPHQTHTTKPSHSKLDSPNSIDKNLRTPPLAFISNRSLRSEGIVGEERGFIPTRAPPDGSPRNQTEQMSMTSQTLPKEYYSYHGSTIV